MTILFFDGFDTYNSAYDAGADNSLNGANGWTATTFASNGITINGYQLGGAVSGSCLRFSWSSSQQHAIERNFSPSSTVYAGVFFEVSDTTLSDLPGLMTVGSTSRYASFAMSDDEYFELLCYPSGQVVTTTVKMLEGVQYHVGVELLADGTANLYVSDTLRATANTGGSGQYDWIRLGPGPPNWVNPIYGYYDHLVVSDTYVGPAMVVPIVPSSTGSLGDDFAQIPGTGDKFDKVDDMASAIGTDLDGTYIESNVANTVQSFGVSATEALTENALAIQVSASSKSANPSPYDIELFIHASSTEQSLGNGPVSTGVYTTLFSPILDQLPGGLPLSQANIESAEIGVRLLKI